MKLDSVRAKHVEDDLTLLFGEAQAPALRVHLDGLLTDHALLREADKPAIGALNERDAVLITYGNTLSAAGEAPLDTLGRFLAEHVGDAVSIVHLLPIFPYSSDDGFSVVDYRMVNPELGDWSNVRALAEHYGLALDLVLNHCSRSHHWFHDFLADRSNAKDWFIEADPHEPALGLVTRPRSTPLLTPVDVSGRGRRWIWTTFSPDQVDLNFRNPEVLLAFAEILLMYLRQGARMLRLDAVAYVWKTLGSACTSLPEVHAVVRILRALVDTAEPGTLLLTETNVPSAENLSYLGEGDEAHLVYQFSLPPLLLHALWRGDTSVLQAWLAELPEPPPGTAYLNFTASHDGVGLRPLEGLVDAAERDAMLADMRTRGGFVSPRRMPDGRESPYELNISYFSALGRRRRRGHAAGAFSAHANPGNEPARSAGAVHSFPAGHAERHARRGADRPVARDQPQALGLGRTEPFAGAVGDGSRPLPAAAHTAPAHARRASGLRPAGGADGAGPGRRTAGPGAHGRRRPARGLSVQLYRRAPACGARGAAVRCERGRRPARHAGCAAYRRCAGTGAVWRRLVARRLGTLNEWPSGPCALWFIPPTDYSVRS